MKKEKISSEELEDSAPVQPEEPVEEPGDGEPEAAGAEETPEAGIARLESEKADLTDQLLRQRAEFENVRKRLDREAGERSQIAEAGLAESLLPVLDALERAMASLQGTGQEDFYKGVELIYRQMLDTLAQSGLEPFESVGQVFDPYYHHAVEKTESTEHEDQEIVEELQRGYKFKDRLLRPALVKVAVHIEPEEDAG